MGELSKQAKAAFELQDRAWVKAIDRPETVNLPYYPPPLRNIQEVDKDNWIQNMRDTLNDVLQRLDKLENPPPEPCQTFFYTGANEGPFPPHVRDYNG